MDVLLYMTMRIMSCSCAHMRAAYERVRIDAYNIYVHVLVYYL